MNTCPNCGHGLTPVTRDDLTTMTPQQIETARQDGRLDQLLNPKGTNR